MILGVDEPAHALLHSYSDTPFWRCMRKLQRGFTLIEVMVALAIVGILMAIAIPSFTRFQARSKQSEAKANLKAVFVAEKSFMQEKERYSALVTEVGFSPERNNRYAYYLVSGGPLVDRSAASEVPVAGANGISVDTFRYADADPDPATWPTGCGQTPAVVDLPTPSFVAGAAGDIDSDDTITATATEVPSTLRPYPARRTRTTPQASRPTIRTTSYTSELRTARTETTQA